MRFDVLTLFPGIFSGYLTQSILKRAIDNGLVSIHLWDFRDWASGKHRQVDDRPFGGGPGMVLMPEPVVSAPSTPAPPAKRPSATKITPPLLGGRGPEPRVTSETSQNSNPPAKTQQPPLPSLDLATLKTRLRQTSAIGVLTKLSLQNQVEDLLDRFRAHHRPGQQASVASLRQPYDMLVLKVLALVQDSDPELARTIAGSREALWGVLADPEKFNSATI